MNASPDEIPMARNVILVLQSALRDGVNRYKAMKDSPESRTLLAGATLAYVGRRFTTIGLIALSYKLGDGVLGVGGMFAAQILPSLFFQPFAGILVDRFPGKRLHIICQLLLATLTLSYLVLLAFPSIWILYALTFVFGTIQTVEMPAMEIRLMLLTHRERRGTANAIQTLCITIGEILGPLLAGVILALAGAATLFVLNAIIYVIFARVVALLPERVDGAILDEPQERNVTDTRKPGYLTLWRRADVRLYTGLVASVYMLFYGLMPLYIVRALDLGRGEGSVGMLYTIAGVGAFAGSIIAGMGAYTSRRALAISGMVAVAGAVSAVVFGVASTLLMAIGGLVFFSFVSDIQEISALTYFQNMLPESLYGRFFSVFMMANGIGGLVGSLAGPVLAASFNPAVAIAVLAFPSLVFGVLLAVRMGGLRLNRGPFPGRHDTEPEVAGHIFLSPFGKTPLSDQRYLGRPALEPRPHRLA